MKFKTMKLSELTVDGRGHYGIGASAVEKSDELYAYLRITDIYDDGTLNKAGLKSVDDPDAEKYLLKPNDIVCLRERETASVKVIFTTKGTVPLFTRAF